MRIGFDAKRAFCNATGLGAYSRAVIGAVRRQSPDADIVLYSPRTAAPNGLFHAPAGALVRTPGGIFKAMHPVWRTFFLPAAIRRDALDIYHGLTNELPRGIEKTGARSVVTIHDLIFLRYPATYAYIDRMVYAAKCRHAVRVAARVVADSRQTRDDIVSLLHCDPARVSVVYPSVDPAYFTALSGETINDAMGRYGLTQPYILSVGSISPRKNLLSLVKAFERVRASAPAALVVCGAGTGGYFRAVQSYIAEKKLSSGVVFLGHADQRDLPALYQGASVFAYPSLFEGFGLPIAEALAGGTPVVTSVGSCFSEAGGPGSLYVDPLDSVALASALERVLGSAEVRSSMAARGRQHALSFTQEALGRELTGIYRSLLRPTNQ